MTTSKTAKFFYDDQVMEWINILEQLKKGYEIYILDPFSNKKFQK